MQSPIDLEAVVDTIHSAWEHACDATALPFRPKLFCENGRYITGPHGWLIARCKAIKQSYSTCVPAAARHYAVAPFSSTASS
ncbi:hypothetical protein EON66_11995 [archaeon]|nr:MAG: hypothetical protein EON66_11995 [archaeon]